MANNGASIHAVQMRTRLQMKARGRGIIRNSRTYLGASRREEIHDTAGPSQARTDGITHLFVQKAMRRQERGKLCVDMRLWLKGVIGQSWGELLTWIAASLQVPSELFPR